MDTSDRNTLADRLAALRDMKAEQDHALAQAEQQLAAMGQSTLVVERSALQAIHDACLVQLPTLTPALRG